MKANKLLILGLCLICIISNSAAQDNNSKILDISLYSNGFAIVHDKRELDIPGGVSEIGIGGLPRDIQPETIFAEFDGYIKNQQFLFQEPHWPDVVYGQFVNQRIALVSESGELVEGILRSHQHGQLWLEDHSGSYIYIPNAHSYRLHTSENPEFISQPRLTWTLDSNRSGVQEVSIYYKVNNLRWNADYLMIIDEAEQFMTLEAKATITNHSGMDYSDARVRLIAGDVNIQQQQPMFRGDMGGAEMMSARDIASEPMFEYHVFQLPDKTTISDQQQKQITLKYASEVAVNKHYTYQTGGLGQVRRNNNRVNVEIRLENTEDYNLGTPLPAGIVRAFQKSGSFTELIGEDRIQHTPEGQEIIVSLGSAFDITIEERQVRLADLASRVREEEREIIITNQKAEDITVEVELRLSQNEELRSSSVEPVEKEARRLLFNVPVEAEEKTTLNLEIRRSN